jgi:hypothetical protein
VEFKLSNSHTLTNCFMNNNNNKAEAKPIDSEEYEGGRQQQLSRSDNSVGPSSRSRSRSRKK